MTHYGCDVGSNEYRECSTVWLVSQFHQPKDVLFSKYLGHAKKLATDDNLEAGQNFRGSLITQLELEHHSTQTKQMGARGTCRDVDGDGVAANMTLNCLWKEADQFTSIVPSVFQGCRLVYPDGVVPSSPKKHTKPVVVKIAEYLQSTDKDCVTASDLNRAGIKIKGQPRKDKIKAAGDMFKGIGWQFFDGERGKKPARFVRQR
ncbi:hypothetical protein [Tateyamaria sp.]|uniref:hypothetical protein n=1 Tax=Tateyamaria sp. TaxID=1929288 RepID=UPI003269F637